MTDDFSQLREIPYSGRHVTAGKTSKGDTFIGYTITGRSPPSQARELLPDGRGVLRTNIITDENRLRKMFNIASDEELAELKKRIEGGNQALLVYDAIVDCGYRLVASNGTQTRLLTEASFRKRKMAISPKNLVEEAMRGPVWKDDGKGGKIDITTYEPDHPNYTQRVSGCADKNSGFIHMVRRKFGRAEKDWFTFDLEPGKAIGATTYLGGNEDPLLPYDKMNPLDFEITSTNAQDLAQSLFDAINHPNPNDGNKNYAVAAAAMIMKDSGAEIARVNRWDGF